MFAAQDLAGTVDYTGALMMVLCAVALLAACVACTCALKCLAIWISRKP